MRGLSPFHHRAAVTDPRHFFGREREQDTVLARTAGASKPQCVSIVGSRRMGKSSLLRQLADVRGAELARAEPPMVSAYHDLEGSGSLDVARFFRTLHRRLEKALGARGAPVPAFASEDAAAAEEAFALRVEDLSDEGVRIVLYLDEFDTVTLNPRFDADLFGRLRYLASSFQLAYVTSSFAELTDLCHQQEIRQSPFFNVFSTMHLGLLDDLAAERLLVEESERAGARFSPDEIAFARELAGAHPFHLQQAANALWEQRGGRAAVLEAYLDDAAPHFRYALAHLSRRRARLLAACAAGEPVDAADPDCRFLVRRGLAVEAEGGVRPFAPAFAEWLRSQQDVLALLRTPVPRQGPLEDESTGTALRPAAAVEGQTLDSRYRLVRELGQGGFGVVFEAEDLLLERAVAIKLLRPDRAYGEHGKRLRERFLHEAQAASRISHPHVVALHDVREHESGWYVVMELFAGGSLRGLLQERGALPVLDALSLARQAAEGLAAAHALGIVHRDVKPDNMLVNEHGELKLVDFGLAFMTAEARLTTGGQVFMTPHYSSPEQVLGEAVDGRADVFSLGAVLQELLVGAPAFEGGSTSAILYRILNHTPPPPPPRLAALAPPVRDVVARCLAREPRDRFASCASLASELARLEALADGGAL